MARIKIEEAGRNKILKSFIWYAEEFKPHKAMGKLKKEDNNGFSGKWSSVLSKYTEDT